MTEFELTRVRYELQQAIDALADEVEGAPNSHRARAVSLDHVRTAALLLTGSASEHIVGQRANHAAQGMEECA